jgi:alpha-beta hydrolase superfamily lysophospholipase
LTDTADDEHVKRRDALRRAMPITRMLDYGMDHWDANQLLAASPTTSWHDLATELAAGQRTRAAAARGRQDWETATACYRRAVAALIFAQLEDNLDTPRKRATYVRLTEAYQDAADIDRALRVDRLSVPFTTATCTAWMVRLPATNPGPPVVIVGGLSGWGPAYHPLAEALARRGLTAVLLEAPGQGNSRLISGLHGGTGMERAVSTTLDVVEAHTGYSGSAGIWGNSFGGLLAARAAVADARLAACCVNGASPSPEVLPFRTSKEQLRAFFGLDDDARIEAALRDLWLDTSAAEVQGALLVLHGEADPLVSLEQQQAFLDLSTRSQLRVWEDGEHTIYNHAAERTELVADWFRSQLGAALPVH